ncbi:MAG: hypothetical protein JNM39_04670 [Bdellovibrionaceae bacterium]|nr:hypothetical protein [Pseudobdellovibrionaceae bacterium]
MTVLHIAFYFGVTSSSVTLAQELRSSYLTNSAGTISRAIKLACPVGQTEVCVKQCGAPSCLIEEAACMSCAGTQSELLRNLFTKASFFYKSSHLIVPHAKVIETIYQLPVVLLEPQSPFNFYTNVRKGDSKNVFQGLCPDGSLNASIVVGLDESGYPERPLFSVCETSESHQEFYSIEEISGL